MSGQVEGLKKIFRRVANSAADLLFPLMCLECGKEGAIACHVCAVGVSFMPVCACPLCGKERMEGRPCEGCASAFFVDGVVGSFNYREQLIAKLIKAWKYNGMNAAGVEIERLLGGWVERAPWVREWVGGSAFVPVPLHRRRLCERGFNQAELLARVWARLLNIPVVNCLERVVYTEAQAKQTGAARQKLSHGVFAMKKGVVLKAQKIILIDDVYTTGSTLNSAARTLREAGVMEVYGLVCARET